MCRFFAVSDFLTKAIERSSEVATRTTAKAKEQLGRAREKWDERQQQLVEKSKRTGVSWLQKAVKSVREFAAELAESDDEAKDNAEEERGAAVESEKPEKSEKSEKLEEESREMEKTKLSELEAGDLVALEALEDEIRRFELNGCEVDAMEVKVGRKRGDDDGVECDVDEWRAMLGDCEKGRREAMRGRSEPEAGHGGEDGEEEGSSECGDAAV